MSWVLARRCGCLAVAFVTAVWASPSALAINRPEVDPGAAPPNGAPGPVQPTEKIGECITTGILAGTDFGAVTPGQQSLDLPAAWRFSRGDGQLVAVLDTGVRPGPRLPGVQPGGDYVESTDGLTDCDGRGTAVAGLIAGQPGPDGFAGIAPAARLVSLRVTSARFSARTGGGDPTVTRASGDIAALGRAIVHAADLGARVITVSAATCLPADRNIDQSALGAAIRYAAVTKDAVIVAAAGNNGSVGTSSGTACDSNPLTDLGRPGDPRNWAGVTSVSVPSWWQPYVLSVASLAPDEQPSKFTAAGPWVGIAAPGENIVSVSNRDDGGLANGLPNQNHQLVPLLGTGYAAGYAAGVAALVRAKYPELTAAQVIQRIAATAHNAARAPSNVVGAGAIDPLAALTWELPASTNHETWPVKQVATPPPPTPDNPLPRTVAFAGTAALTVAVVVAAAIAARRRKEPNL
ncbi:type VII secretion-associated serine protease mycosin [Mycobacterium shigaense]|uniref:Type VII secretion-associated serine protease n=1 Tax=Mycobacterium shigaense TaxID=722731 RepID=A0A1Z4EHV2_9MYCO|nr:type VII secretion-associated serine protease mycosin [Mycobacterium shigaense]MEA1124681.1 type VII secretion-associated serine protease mycosin [Mycobacterium shigaense]PRI14152.1 type VII secretion-associated serine protease mycosin [Mycobacterium shigaense]BAX92496.1 type VII secretion-associated serine protease [Mycobacterium shigaense]